MQNEIDRNDVVWTTPKLAKLGKLEDVAPGPPGAKEGTSGKS